MRTLRALVAAALLVSGSATAQNGAPPRRAPDLDERAVPLVDQQVIAERLSSVLETERSGVERAMAGPGGNTRIFPEAAVSWRTGRTCGSCDDACRPFRYEFQPARSGSFVPVEGLACRVASARWLVVRQDLVRNERAEEEARAARERLQERLAQERAVQDRAVQDRLAQEQLAQERLAQERAERQERERLAQERAERQERERVAQVKLAQDRTERERADRADRERAERERSDRERLQAARQVAGLREGLGRMLYLGAGEADLERAIAAFLADRRLPASLPRDMVQAQLQVALASFDRIPSCGERSAEPVCRP